MLQKKLWQIIFDVIVTCCDDEKKFKNNHLNFYESLISFVYCLCGNKISSEEKGVQRSSEVLTVCEDLETKDNGRLFKFLYDVLACYLYDIFVNNCVVLREHFVKITLRTLNIKLLTLTTNRKLELSNSKNIFDIAPSELDACGNFVEVIVVPLLANEENANVKEDLVKLLIGLVKILSGSDKEKYLISIFQVSYSFVMFYFITYNHSPPLLAMILNVFQLTRICGYHTITNFCPSCGKTW